MWEDVWGEGRGALRTPAEGLLVPGCAGSLGVGSVRGGLQGAALCSGSPGGHSIVWSGVAHQIDTGALCRGRPLPLGVNS